MNANVYYQQENVISMIPEPSKKTLLDDYFHLKSTTKIIFKEEILSIVSYFREIVLKTTGFKLERQMKNKKTSVILLEIDYSLQYLSSEGYLLDISPQKIEIRASDPQGIFYAIQSVRQMLPLGIENESKEDNIEWKIACVKIEDIPRFKWRGFMFDVGRHFHSISTIKKYLDLLALLKMNVFHWHLTDDQGWRIEIKKYPKLTNVGSKRKDTKIGGWTSRKYRGKPHEGFYTQEEIKEIVDYAAERFITIIPEIEMPGHASAAVASYPELSCMKEQIDVPSKFGIFTDVYCAGQDYTYEFLENVLDEVLELFPSNVIHIGGDEVKKKHWKECEECQKRMKEENISEIGDLHTYFAMRIDRYLTSKGRRMMGWNEILEDEINTEVIGQYWALTGKKNVLKHLRKGGEIVISDFFRYYLDYSYLMTPLKKTYKFEPVPKELEPDYHCQILGVEAPIWTEWVPNIERLDWQVLPRLVAVAETGWTSKENKNYSNFKQRLFSLNERLEILGFKPASLEEVDPSRIIRFLKARKVFKWPEI